MAECQQRHIDEHRREPCKDKSTDAYEQGSHVALRHQWPYEACLKAQNGLNHVDHGVLNQNKDEVPNQSQQ